MNRVKEVARVNAADLASQLRASASGEAGSWDISKSWHAAYSDSAYVYVGGLPYELSEGDVATVMAQWGEIVDVNMPREKATGKPKGFAFICYEDQRSTILAVDNFNGAKLLGRTVSPLPATRTRAQLRIVGGRRALTGDQEVRCDHCRDYREEQVKDPNAIPEHVARRLSETELEKKKREIEERNAEIMRTAAEKEQRFAEARGTAATSEDLEEAQLRAELISAKEAAASAKRTSHIEAVLARRKREHDKEMETEKRRQAEREERRRKRELDEMTGARRDADKRSGREIPPPPPPQGPLRGPSGVEDGHGDAELVFDRLMGGDGSDKKKKKKKRHREHEAGASLFKKQAVNSIDVREQKADGRGGNGAAAPTERKRMGEESMSVDETNAMRESLGLKPLR